MEQGHFDELSVTGGYVSSFSQQPADWLYKPDYNVVPSKGPSITRKPLSQNVAESSQDLDAEANRRTGDVSIYLYYIGSIGWPTTLVFIFGITVFVFCTAFPSTYIPTPSHFPLANNVCSNLAQVVGYCRNGIAV